MKSSAKNQEYAKVDKDGNVVSLHYTEQEAEDAITERELRLGFDFKKISADSSEKIG